MSKIWSNLVNKHSHAKFDIKLLSMFLRNRESTESLESHIFSSIKHLYYRHLCKRMAESHEYLVVLYDFLCLFKVGRITVNDINEISKFIENR